MKNVNHVIFVYSKSRFYVSTSDQVKYVCYQSMLRTIKYFNKQVDFIATVHANDAFLNATKRVSAKPFTDIWKAFLFPLCELLVSFCSFSLLPQRHTPPSVSSREPRKLLDSMHCTRASSSALPESGVTMRKRSRIFATHHLRGACKVADSKKNLLCNVFFALYSIVLEIRWRQFGYQGFCAAIIISVLVFLIWNKPQRTYPNWRVSIEYLTEVVTTSVRLQFLLH